MATVAIVLNTTKKLSNGEFSVTLRVSHLNSSKYYAIGKLLNNQNLRFQTFSQNWMPARPEDDGLGKFKRTVKDYKELNTLSDLNFSNNSITCLLIAASDFLHFDSLGSSW